MPRSGLVRPPFTSILCAASASPGLVQWPIARRGYPDITILQVGHSVTASLLSEPLMTVGSALFFKISLIF